MARLRGVMALRTTSGEGDRFGPRSSGTGAKPCASTMRNMPGTLSALISTSLPAGNASARSKRSKPVRTERHATASLSPPHAASRRSRAFAADAVGKRHREHAHAMSVQPMSRRRRIHMVGCFAACRLDLTPDSRAMVVGEAPFWRESPTGRQEAAPLKTARRALRPSTGPGGEDSLPVCKWFSMSFSGLPSVAAGGWDVQAALGCRMEGSQGLRVLRMAQTARRMASATPRSARASRCPAWRSRS